MTYEIVEISESNQHFHNQSVEAFELFGKLEVSFQNEAWQYTEVLFDVPSTKTYDPEKMDLKDYMSNPSQVILFAVSEGAVLGQIVIRKHWNKFCFIDDIAVRQSARQKGVASALIHKAQEWATEKGLKGFMLETQEINLAACRLYMRNGFVLGGVDTMLYSNFDTKDEKALFWYKIF